MAAITYDHATVQYPGAERPSVNALNLDIADGEFLVLVGPSGCGKSTSLRALAGLENVTEGTIRIGDEDIAWARDAGAEVVFVCSPNNPTGTAQTLDTIADLAAATDALVIVDEAYADFGGESALPLVADRANVAVVRTFSKAFALAGARIGYVLASPTVVEDLRRVRLPYHLSALTQAAGVTALRHADEAAASIDAIREQRDRLVETLSRIDGATVFPSRANFVLFQPPGDAKATWQALLDRGVLIRDLSHVVPNALRVTAGTAHEVDLFLKSLEEVLT
jgi:histidinol-phosphate aminotransferase